MHELTIKRLLKAPRALVYAMWSEPEHMNQWCGPKNFTIIPGEMDFREGGVWSCTLRAPDGQNYPLRGVYREIKPLERIAFTHQWLEGATPGRETVVTLSFADEGNGTRLTFHQAFFEAETIRNSHEEGWSETLNNLEAYLAALHEAGLKRRV